MKTKKIYSLILLAVALLCAPTGVKATTPFTEGFESSTLPVNWTTIHVSGSSTYVWKTEYNNYYVKPHSGSYSAFVSYASSGGHNNYLVTPQLNPVEGETLRFYIASQNYAGTTVTVEVSEAGNTDPADFATVLATYQSQTNINTTWLEQELSLSAYVGKNIYIAFHVVDNNGGHIYLDDVSVLAPVTCPKPTELGYSGLTSTSVELSWTNGGTESSWIVSYKAGNAEWTSVPVTTNPYTLATEASTEYQIKVQADCGGGDTSEESNVVTFTTPCDAVSAMPWTEDFESYAENILPDCWDNTGSTVVPSGYGAPAVVSWGVFEVNSSKVIRMANYYAGPSGTHTALINSPQIVLPASGAYELSFDYSHTANCGALKVKVSKDGGSNFTELGSYAKNGTGNNYGTTTGEFETVEAISLADYAGETIILQFYTDANYGNGAIFIDNVGIQVQSNCAKPKNVTATATPDGAVVTWEQGKDETAYLYACVATGETPASWTAVEGTERSLTLTGLNAGTYDVYVRSDCSETAYAFATFTPACAAPANVAATALEAHTATLAWDAVAGISRYQYACVAKDAEPDWTGVEPKEGLSAELTGLTAATAYDFYVRSYFSESVQSEAAKFSFTTNCDTYTLPFVQKFDAATLPNCWETDDVSNGKWAIYSWTDESYDGYSMRFAGKSGYSATLQSPAIALNDKAQLSFYWKNSSGISVDLKISKDGGVTKEALVNSLSAAQTTYKQQAIDLSAYAGETVILYWTATAASGSSQRYVYMDELRIDYAPVATVTNVVATPSNGTATITWECAEEGATFNLQYRATDAEEWTAVDNLTEATCTIEGLTNDTEYEVQVQAVASANRVSEWTASVTVTPAACPEVTGIELTEKTYSSVKVSWTATGNGTWIFEYSDGTTVKQVTDLTTTEYVLTNLSTGTTYTIKVKPVCAGGWHQTTTFVPTYTAPATASVTNATDTSAVASWAAVADAEAEGYEYIVVVKDAEVNWENAVATTETSAELKGLNGLTDYDFYVRATYPESGASEYAKAEFATIAYAPANLTAGEITTTSAVFSWEYEGAATLFQWSTDGENWSEPQTAKEATAENLTAATSYIFHVRAYYAGGKYSEAATAPFATACDEFVLPFVEDFEKAGALPNCWDAEPQWTMDAYNYYKSAYYSARFNANTANSAELKTPAIRLDKKAELTFYYRNNSSIQAEVLVYDGENTITLIEALPSTGGEATVMTAQEKVNLSAYEGKTVNIIFRAHGKNANESLYIDDIKVAEKEDDTTGMESTCSDEAQKAVKIIENGQLYLMYNGTKYSVQGMIVNE